MKIYRTTVVAVAALAVSVLDLIGGSASTPPAQQPQTVQATALQQRLDGLLTDSRYRGSQVSLLVRDATTGEVLYDRDSGNRLLPASNMKLFTSTAAMHTLGPDFRFHTDVLTTAPKHGSVLLGDLYLKGYGDPTALADDYAALARQVAASGIRKVFGNVVADDTYFDSVRLGNFWSWDDEPFYYSAQTSALTVAPDTDYDSGTVIVESLPGATVGAPVKLTLVPQTGAIRVVNTATTGAAGSAYTLNVERDHGSNVVRVTGSVPADDTGGQDWVTVWEPATYAADVFKRALAAAGVQVFGGIKPGTAPAGGKVLAKDESMTLSELLVPFMKLSNNMHAEALVKTMGAQAAGDGSWDAGLESITAYLQRAGADAAAQRITDGSGLSRGDMITTDSISDVLLAAQREPWFDKWYASMPVAGNPDRFVGGTLRNRMRGTPAANNVRAKTGSLTGVTALSGYVTDRDGRKLVFSMIANNFMSSPRTVEDAVAVTLASWPQQTAVAATRDAANEHELEWCAVKSC